MNISVSYTTAENVLMLRKGHILLPKIRLWTRSLCLGRIIFVEIGDVFFLSVFSSPVQSTGRAIVVTLAST